MATTISVIMPARNEGAVVGDVVRRVRAVLPQAEIIVVDDGSSDDTAAQAAAAGAQVLRHPIGLGNGAAVKTGARAAQGELLVTLDADGQHPPEAIPALLAELDRGYDMVVGARDRAGQASAGRAVANGVYNRFASWVSNYPIRDLTSGFRVARTARFRQFLSLFPNRFSYPTTVTMAFVKMGYPVSYVPVTVARRTGSSHLSPLQDGVRFLMIIFKVGALFSPAKIFLPTSAALVLLGLSNYAYTFATQGRFTNMSALLLTFGILVFLLGLIAEQITTLIYAVRRE